jgi:hypothetical protein
MERCNIQIVLLPYEMARISIFFNMSWIHSFRMVDDVVHDAQNGDHYAMLQLIIFTLSFNNIKSIP